MTRKTESLSYPKNPLVALRELQDLNDPLPVANGHDSTTKRAAEALPQSSATSRVVAPADGSDSAHATSSVPSSPESIETADATGSDDGSATSSVTQARKRKPATRPKEDEPPDDTTGPSDPLAAAVRQMLSRPYTADARKGPFTVSTVKMPTEVSERLGWVATLTGKAKQEILADALKDYFAKVLREG
jgi:hypothetical protein